MPTYPGTRFAEMNKILPAPIVSSIALAIKDMDKKLRGFADKNAVLTAVESRTSSPVRIERDENLTSPFASNLYPCGEGAGYSGGITSSSADGLRVARRNRKTLVQVTTARQKIFNAYFFQFAKMLAERLRKS